MTLVRSSAEQLFPELARQFKDFTGATASALLRWHAAASGVRRLSLASFLTEVRADFHGQRLLV